MAAVGAPPPPPPPDHVDPKPDMPQSENPSSSLQETPSTTQTSNTNPDQSTENSNPDQNPNSSTPALTTIPPVVPPFAPSFRPLGAPQFPAVPSPNPNFPMGQATVVQPPGVSVAPAPGLAVRPVGVYQTLPGQPPVPVQMPFGQVPGGYMHVQTPGAIPPGGF